MVKGKISWSSILIGTLTFGLLGFAIFNQLIRLSIINSVVLKSIFVICGVILGSYFGFKHPLGTEAWSFGITGLIFIQAWWDTSYDITGLTDPRVLTGGIAILIFLLNSFTGQLKKRTAKKQFRKLFGR